jgi:hypothetical protein
LVASFSFDRRSGGVGAADEFLCRRAMFDVPHCVDECHQQSLHPQLQHWRAGSINTAGSDLLFDLHSFETSPSK